MITLIWSWYNRHRLEQEQAPAASWPVLLAAFCVVPFVLAALSPWLFWRMVRELIEEVPIQLSLMLLAAMFGAGLWLLAGTWWLIGYGFLVGLGSWYVWQEAQEG